jgi:hypothetical protein
MMQMMSTQRPPIMQPMPLRGGRGGLRGPMGRPDYGGWPWPFDGIWQRSGNGAPARWADGAGDAWNGVTNGYGSAFRGPGGQFPWAWGPVGRTGGYGTGNGFRPHDQRTPKRPPGGK